MEKSQQKTAKSYKQSFRRVAIIMGLTGQKCATNEQLLVKYNDFSEMNIVKP